MTSHSWGIFSFWCPLRRECAGKAREAPQEACGFLEGSTDREKDSSWMVLKAAITACPAQPLRLQEPPKGTPDWGSRVSAVSPQIWTCRFTLGTDLKWFWRCGCLCWFPLKFHWYIVMKMETSPVFLVMKVHFSSLSPVWTSLSLPQVPPIWSCEGVVGSGFPRAYPVRLDWSEMFCSSYYKKSAWNLQCYPTNKLCLWKQKEKTKTKN